MTWRDVLDAKFFGKYNLCSFAIKAKEIGYKFIAWNGRIYFVDDEGNSNETNLTVEDLK